MGFGELIPSARRWLAAANPWLDRFGRWWIAQCVDLVPERFRELVIGGGRKLLALSLDNDRIRLELSGRDRKAAATDDIRLADYSMASVDRFLQAHGLARTEVDIGLRLPADRIFVRSLLLPAEAASSVDSIAELDLSRRTPFKLADVYHGHSAAPADDRSKIAVLQWITRRSFVEQAAAPLQIDVGRLAFVDAAGAGVEAEAAPFIPLHSGRAAAVSWVRRSMLGLCASAAVLVSAAAGTTWWRQQTALDDLDAQIATARVKAQHVRAAIDRLEQKQDLVVRVRSRKAAAGLVDILEEATRVLPAHSWLTEFRLSETADRGERQLTLTGFSGSAPGLVGLFNASAMFAETALTSPVTMDVAEGRERFSLQTRIGRALRLSEAAR